MDKKRGDQVGFYMKQSLSLTEKMHMKMVFVPDIQYVNKAGHTV